MKKSKERPAAPKTLKRNLAVALRPVRPTIAPLPVKEEPAPKLGKPGQVVEWSEEEKRELALHQSRGDKQAVVRMMKEKQEGTPRDIRSLDSR